MHPTQDTSADGCAVCKQGPLGAVYEAPSFDTPAERFALKRCASCGVVCTSPAPQGEALAAYYRSEYYGGDGGRPSEKKFVGWMERLVTLQHRWRAARLAARMDAKGRPPREMQVLDVGCGRGGFLQEMGRLGYTCTGIDIGDFSDIAEHGERLYTFRRGPLESHRFPDETFDAVSIWHVLEHLPDPVATLQELARVLKPNGVLSLAVPNIDSLQARLFAPAWFHLDLPRHLFHFGPQSLGALLQQAGFRTVREHTLSLEQNLYGGLQSAQNALLPSVMQNRLYTLLKRHGTKTPTELGELVALGGLSAWMMPAVVAETLGSAALGQGATLIVYARRE